MLPASIHVFTQHVTGHKDQACTVLSSFLYVMLFRHLLYTAAGHARVRTCTNACTHAFMLVWKRRWRAAWSDSEFMVSINGKMAPVCQLATCYGEWGIWRKTLVAVSVPGQMQWTHAVVRFAHLSTKTQRPCFVFLLLCFIVLLLFILLFVIYLFI